MQRRLVLSNPTAGHPLRRLLPPPVVEPVDRQPLGPLGLFTLTFASAFLAFSAFLA